MFNFKLGGFLVLVVTAGFVIAGLLSDEPKAANDKKKESAVSSDTTPEKPKETKSSDVLKNAVEPAKPEQKPESVKQEEADIRTTDKECKDMSAETATPDDSFKSAMDAINEAREKKSRIIMVDMTEKNLFDDYAEHSKIKPIVVGLETEVPSIKKRRQTVYKVVNEDKIKEVLDIVSNNVKASNSEIGKLVVLVDAGQKHTPDVLNAISELVTPHKSSNKLIDVIYVTVEGDR